MSAENFTHDGQAETCPFFILAAGKIRLVEALENGVLLATRDSDPMILDRDENVSVLLIGFQSDRGAGAAEFDGVVDQIVEDLLNAVLIRVDVKDIAGQDPV